MSSPEERGRTRPSRAQAERGAAGDPGGTPRILVLQHHPLEHPGVIGTALTDAGADLDVCLLYEGAPCPATPDGYDGLIVMGGPMSVSDDEEHPWLADERSLLARAITIDMPVLGVCLGSQLIASVAGAEVRRGPVAEIGWHRITTTAAAADDPLFAGSGAFAALEWHRDAFPLPPNAVALAASANYPVQAFRIGRRVYGLLFHLETDPAMVEAWCQVFAWGAPLPRGDADPDFAVARTRAVTMATRLFLAK